MSTSTIQTINLLPEYLRTDKNAKFLSSTIDQLLQPAQLERIDGYIGSKLSPTYNSTSNVYIPETLPLRRNYQLAPAVIINDQSETIQDAIALDDLINEISIKGGQTSNLDRMFRSQFFSYDPHIDWDKLINYQQYYWLATGPEVIVLDGDIDIEADILGSAAYTSANDIILSNGMKVSFSGTVTPSSYQNKEYFVEGVGTSIKLIDYDLLVTPDLIASQYSDYFDTNPFDEFPFDTQKRLPIIPDYITINRASVDLNPWSRYNRWVHADVIAASAKANGVQPVYPVNLRAQRPIIEFKADLKLYNFGTQALTNVDLFDTYTTDAFSIVEGSAGYYVDGAILEQGQRVIFNADLDPLVRGVIFEVNYNNINGIYRLELVKLADSVPNLGDSLVINSGDTHAGSNWWFNGTEWQYAQQHYELNQAPLFDLFDNTGYSYGDKAYHLTDFQGSKIFSYQIGIGSNDPVLGFPVSVQNSVGIGSYVFENNFMTDVITVTDGQTTYQLPTSVAYCKFIDMTGDRFANVWTQATDYQIPILQFQSLTQSTSSVIVTAVDDAALVDMTLDVFLDNTKLAATQYTVSVEQNQRLVNFVDTLSANTNVLFKIYTDAIPNDNGYYETPLSLTNNPLNGPIATLTLSELSDHLQSMTYRLPDLTGSFPGASNIRDLGDIEKYGSRLISNIDPLAFSNVFLGKREHNAADATSAVANQYNQFKMALLRQLALSDNQTDPVAALDTALLAINTVKDLKSPYFLSDMLPYGTDKSVRKWTVIRSSNKTYPISAAFDVTSLSMRAVLIYLNDTQLLLGRDYNFDAVDSTVTILVDLVAGDEVQIVEYNDTSGCYVPPTPTKLGLYPKFLPAIFSDDTYASGPKNVIQGHDGSIMVAYDDFRDAVILEFEKRVYNNIKATYDLELFNIDSVIPGAFRSTEYSRTEINNIIQQEFIKWAGLYQIDYTTNSTFDAEDPFTWNYAGAYNTSLNKQLSGYWRGIYQYFYGTDRPHTHPWEMLGFTQQPDWWISEYGDAPYTSTNTQLWNDLEQGNIRQGTRQGIDEIYVRTGLSSILPVDTQGHLVDPTTHLSSNNTPYNIRQGWVFGDQAPAETAWRRSSYWPFVVTKLMLLTKPAVYASRMYDPSSISKNIAGQYTYGTDHEFLKIKKSNIFGESGTLTTGYSVFVAEVGTQRNADYIKELRQDLTYINLNLFYKVGGFVSKDKIRVTIDAIEPTSPGPGALLPTGDYRLILNVSNPIKSVGISGIIIQKINGNFLIKGYDQHNPFFNVLTPIRNSNTPSITVGGISETYVKWEASTTSGISGLSAAETTSASAAPANRFYQKGQVVSYNNKFYRVSVSHQAESVFDTTYYQMLPYLPTKGGASVQTVARFSDTTIAVPYGTEVSRIQDVYDIIVGYGAWLQTQGFEFDEYNTDFNSSIDWNFTAKEFLFWTTQNWADNNIITLSPFADQIKYKLNQSVVDNIFDSFYEYSILQANGQPMPKTSLSITRDNGLCTINTINRTDGIYFARLNSVQKEHAMVFNNATEFGDTIYNQDTGYRQQRMILSGFRTSSWDGDYFSPGFIYDVVDIKDWKPYANYLPSDVVQFNGKYYAAIKRISGSNNFNFAEWDLLPNKPTSELLGNFDYRINQFEDFYSLDIDNFDSGQQRMAQHLTGYTPRVYLNNIFTDPIAQYKFYQGFIREKGTKNAISKLSKASIHNLQGQLSYNEEWAFRVGNYGSYSSFREIETVLHEGTFGDNPQVITFVDTASPDPNDLIYYSTASDRVIVPDGYVSTMTFVTSPSTYLVNDFKINTAGYVRIDDVTATALDEAALLNITSTDTIYQDSTVWLGFTSNDDWDVLRYDLVPVKVETMTPDAFANGLVITTDRNHGLQPGDFIAITQANTTVDGVYKIISVPNRHTFTVNSTQASLIRVPLTGPGLIFKFVSMRYSHYSMLPDDAYLLNLVDSTLLWVDDAGDGKWAVYQKAVNYKPTGIESFVNLSDQQLGYSISKRSDSDIVVVGAPGYFKEGNYGAVYVYQHNDASIIPIFSYSLNQLTKYTNSVLPTDLGYSVIYDDNAIYTGNGLIFAGAPAASYIKTITTGTVNLASTVGTTSTYVQQGAVKISSFKTNIAAELAEIVLLSPSPSNYERFGSSIYVQRNQYDKLVLVGATQRERDSADYHGTGHVYAFKVHANATTSSVTATYISTISTSSIAGPNNGSEWGKSISGSDDASVIAISAPGWPNKSVNSGTVLIYAYDGDVVNYVQTITSPFEPGSRFGDSVRVSPDGSYLFVSAPYAKGADKSYGKVAVYTMSNGMFVPDTLEDGSVNIIKNPISNVDMIFGFNLDIDSTNETLVISSLGTNRSLKTTFDKYSHRVNETTFDSNITTFHATITDSGSVYVYNRKFKRFVLTQELSPITTDNGTNFGKSVVLDSATVYVGAPAYSGTATSAFYQFDKIDVAGSGFKVLRSESDLVDVTGIQRVALIDTFNDDVMEYLEVIDPVKGKIAGIADAELAYKSAFDPAIYSQGNSVTVVDADNNWQESKVGMLWWDLSTVKYVWYEQGDSSFRKNHWGKLFPGSSVDVYEWVGSEYMPSEWKSQADTSAGLALGISGTPKYPDNSVMSVNRIYNTVTGSYSNYYYYWVKNKVTVPHVKNRRMAAKQVAAVITDPTGYGLKYAAILSTDSLSLANIGPELVGNRINLNVSFDVLDNSIPRHTEWLLLQEGSETSVPNTLLEKKLFDSLLGHDSLGNIVPDPALSARVRYGIEIRPRQSMFVDRYKALRNITEFANEILLANHISGNYDFVNLNQQEQYPDIQSHEYDQVVEDNQGLFLIDTSVLKTAIISCTGISDGKLRAVSIDDPGYGYRISPKITVGNAVIMTEIDAVGRIVSATITNPGSGFTEIPAITVRPYTVVVVADSDYNGKWTIFAYDVVNSIWVRSRTQKYNTTLYWYYVNWQSSAYNEFVDYAATIADLGQLGSISLTAGQYVKVTNGGLGSFVILEKTNDLGDFSPGYNIVFAQNGTIQISKDIWDIANSGFGFDEKYAYDQTLFDQTPDLELQYILMALRDDIFINTLKVNWNLLFFKAVKYAMTEQKSLDWAFKTSFINVTNQAGNLDQRPVYKLTNSTFFEQYINEVKPYHTVIRNFTTENTVFDPSQTYVTDFDLPAVYDEALGTFNSVNVGDPILNEYPWKSWADNYGYSISSIDVVDGGSNYTEAPVITISPASGDTGSGATAVAYIGSGKVTAIDVKLNGSGYKKQPIINIQGGGSSVTTATAYARLSNATIRKNTVTVKFDRIARASQIGNNIVTDQFVCDGKTSEFVLNWLAMADKTKVQVSVNGLLVLNADFSVVYFTETSNGYSKKYSKVVFLAATPAVSSIVSVTYPKSFELQHAVERIQNYYSPNTGMPGKDLSQLMSGIEYPDTQIQGIPLAYTNNWDVAQTRFGEFAWEADVDYYTKAYVVTTATTGSTYLILDSVAGITPGQYVNIISTTTNRFVADEVKVKTVNTNTKRVTLSSAVNDTVYASTTTYQVEFWNYDANVSALDSAIDAGTWDSYGNLSGALGVNPEDITIDGDSFYSPASSYAPEELVPGQITESIGINVYTKTDSGSPLIFSDNFDVMEINTTTTHRLSLVPPSIDNIVVVFDSNILNYTSSTDFVSADEFTIDWQAGTMTVAPQTAIGKVGYTVVSMGGGNPGDPPGVIDVNFTTTTEPIAQVQSLAYYTDVVSAYVTVNGVSIPEITDINDYGYMLTYSNLQNQRAAVDVYNLSGGKNTVQAWFFGNDNIYYNEISHETFVLGDEPTNIYTLTNTRRYVEPADAQIMIEVSDVTGQNRYRLNPPFISYHTVYGSNIFAINPHVANEPNTFYVGNVRVYLNGVKLTTFDFTVNSDNTITVIKTLQAGDTVAIVDLANPYDYDILDSELTIIAPVPNSILKVMTYANNNGMLMQTEKFNAAPTKRYKLNRPVLNDNYVWVTVDGIPLTSKLDYQILDDQVTVQLNSTPNTTGQSIVITSVSSSPLSATVLGYRIFTDIFQRTHFKRLSAENSTYLVRPLNFDDTEIHVADSTVLTPPIPNKKIPGVVLINGERVEFFKIKKNVLSQLRRGTLGTAPKHFVDTMTKVIDQSPDQTIPFTETILKQHILTTSTTSTYDISTTTSHLIGDGIVISTATTVQPAFEPIYNNVLYTTTVIPPEDQILVYYGGRQLNKVDTYYHDTTVAYDSDVVNILGTVAEVDSLPITKILGDAYTIASNDQVWVYKNSSEVRAVNGYVYNGLNRRAPEFVIDAEVGTITLDITGGIGDNIELLMVKRQMNRADVWNDEISDIDTASLLNSTTAPARFLQDKPAALPDNYYYSDPTLTDDSGYALTDENDNPLQGF